MEEGKICSFFGHSAVADKVGLYIIAVAEILNAVAQGCRTFYFEGFGEFNELCYKIVTKIKDERFEGGIGRIDCVRRERDLAIIDRSDYVIFYAEERGDREAYEAYEYAKKKTEKRIVNLWQVQAIERAERRER